MTIHPAADIFPPMSDAEYRALVDDIRENGLIEPVWTLNGQILDGRHRFRACKELEAPLPMREYDGDNPTAFVVSLNLKRRHLDESQRGMVAGRLATAPMHRPVSGSIDLLTQPQAAELLNVSVPTVKRATVVLDRGAPELIAAVDQGEIAVSKAAEIARLPETEQVDIVRGVTPHVAQNSGDNEWYTPAPYIEAARSTMGEVDLDPASSATANEVVKASQFFSEEENGLCQAWHGRVWMNPPYAQPAMGAFAEKLVDEFTNGKVDEAVVLVNNATETKWFQSLAACASAICFPLARVRFWHPEKVSAPLQGQAVLYLGNNVDRFASSYSGFGFVCLLMRP